MDGAPKFTYDFVMGQLRVVLIAALAFAGGKGWLTPNDATLLTTIATGLGPLLIPWAWSVFSNLGMVHVGSGSAAATMAKVEAVAPVAAAAAANKVADTVVKILLATFVLSVLFLGSPAMAKEQRAKHVSRVQPRETLVMLTGNLKNDLQNLTGTKLTGSVAEDLIAALDTKLLPDLKYAKLLADASGSKVTAPCWQAWADVITIRQKAVQDQNGQDVPMPDPAVITKFEKLVEIRNMLQPDSDFMIKCSPVASMVGKDIRGLMGLVVSGGAGLAALGIGL